MEECRFLAGFYDFDLKFAGDFWNIYSQNCSKGYNFQKEQNEQKLPLRKYCEVVIANVDLKFGHVSQKVVLFSYLKEYWNATTFSY